jgi:NAD-dependent SIR2 family protein deacetylase
MIHRSIISCQTKKARKSSLWHFLIDQFVINEEIMTRKKKEETRKFYESFLLDENGIEFVYNHTFKESLKEAKKYCYIPVKNYDDLRHKIKELNFLSIERASQWEKSTIPILNNNGNIQNFSYCQANYNIVNK